MFNVLKSEISDELWISDDRRDARNVSRDHYTRPLKILCSYIYIYMEHLRLSFCLGKNLHEILLPIQSLLLV